MRGLLVTPADLLMLSLLVEERGSVYSILGQSRHFAKFDSYDKPVENTNTNI